jgi:hypothetical protein
MTMTTLLSLLIYLAILGLIYWLVMRLPLPAPFPLIVQIVFVIIVIVLLFDLLGGAGLGLPRLR